MTMAGMKPAENLSSPRQSLDKFARIFRALLALRPFVMLLVTREWWARCWFAVDRKFA
jgi:hypothetical protein